MNNRPEPSPALARGGAPTIPAATTSRVIMMSPLVSSDAEDGGARARTMAASAIHAGPTRLGTRATAVVTDFLENMEIPSWNCIIPSGRFRGRRRLTPAPEGSAGVDTHATPAALPGIVLVAGKFTGNATAGL